MGRHKEFAQHELPAGVVSVVLAIISDYERRRIALKRGVCSENLTLWYTFYNDTINDAMTVVEEPLRSDFLDDIARGRGYRYSVLNTSYTSWSYYARKREVIWRIAVGLDLVEGQADRNNKCMPKSR